MEDYEKLYKNAVKRIQTTYQDDFGCVHVKPEEIFPELKETEFEKQVSHLIASAINKEHEYNEGFVKWTSNVLLNYAKHELEKKDGLSYPYQPGWKKNYSGNKPKVKHSVLMLTTHGIAEGEWLGEEWCQYRWSCKVKDTEVLYWMHLSDLENLEKENEKRVEQKPTWSEEEKARIDKIIDVLDWAEEKGHIRYSDWEDYVCYVKSLKPQNTWKPSDEQIEVLYKYAEQNNHDGSVLTSLYRDLKKLM